MTLSPDEQEILDSHIGDFTTELSNEELASKDFRVQSIVDLFDTHSDVLGVERADHICRAAEDCVRVADEYCLDPEGIMRAMQMARERRLLGEA